MVAFLGDKAAAIRQVEWGPGLVSRFGQPLGLQTSIRDPVPVREDKRFRST
jgi:hypothetical protein